VDKQDISATQRSVRVTIPASMSKELFTKTVENLKKVVGDLPGFRKDKIPLSLIVTNVGGQRQFKITCELS
jgi:FKBP-type peptidyl-prolyl cis-trans isomerase (trigger factor)